MCERIFVCLFYLYLSSAEQQDKHFTVRLIMTLKYSEVIFTTIDEMQDGAICIKFATPR